MFIEASNKIDNRMELNQQQKLNYKKLLFDKILEKLYTKEDMLKFQNMFGNMIVIIPRKQQFITNK